MDIVLSLVLGFVLLYVIASIFSYYDNLLSHSIRVNLKTFKSWYILNPDRYTLGYHSISMVTKTGTEKIQMSNPFEKRRYLWFRRSIEKKKTQEYLNNKHIHVLETVQLDIDRLLDKAEKEKQEAIETQTKIIGDFNITSQMTR